MGKASRGKRNKSGQVELSEAKKELQARFGKNVMIRTNLPQAEKISNALSVMIDGEVPMDASFSEYEYVLKFIVFAWNLSILDAEKRAEEMERLFNQIDFPDANQVRDMIEKLIIRKEAFFPNDKRYILSCDAVQGPQCFGIKAAAVSLNANQVQIFQTR